MAELTTTSYAILGLLNIKPWSAYELTQQAQRSLRYLWPKSESHLYAEPKRLVRMGFARGPRLAAGPSSYTSGVPNHRPPAGAPSNAGSRASQHPRNSSSRLPFDSFTPTRRTRTPCSPRSEHTERARKRYAEGMLLPDAWLSGEAPFPERLHISALVAVFTRDLTPAHDPMVGVRGA